MAELKDAVVNMDITEAYGLAVQVEEDGYALYQKAIEITENERAVEDLEFLRDQEKGHKAYFEKLLKSTGKEYNAGSDSPLYKWVEENLISPVRAILDKKTPESFQEALRLGLELEENSIRFYKEMKKASDSKENSKAINKIIAEEKRHKKFLTAVLRYSS